MEEKIIQAYTDLLLADMHPITVHGVCAKAGIEEKDFYSAFSTIEEIPRRVWARLADGIKLELGRSEAYQKYGAREKVLAYYFTFFEKALPHRSFIEKTRCSHSATQTYRDTYKEFMAEVVQDGIAMDEIKERLSLSNQYPAVLWELHKTLIEFWLRDTSEQFVDTERAIEVYSKVPLELMGHNVLDSLAETAKFALERLGKTDFKKFFRL